MNVSYDEYKKLEALTNALDERKKEKPETDTADLDKQIKAVSEGTHESPGLGPVNRDLGRLLFGIESADQRPSAPQLQAVDEQCSALTKVLALWKATERRTREAESAKFAGGHRGADYRLRSIAT